MATSLFRNIAANLAHPEHGWKTTHFWGPVANWGIVAAAVYDASYKGPETIDVMMTSTMVGYSSLFIAFAWSVQPRNYILFACHSFNLAAQLNQIRRSVEYQLAHVPGSAERLSRLGQQITGVGIGLGALILSSGRIKTALTAPAVPTFISNIVAHPAGPMTVFFWAPTTKWFLSANNLSDLNKPTEKISLAQQAALTLTGLIWTRYSFVIKPVNYNLAIVNATLGVSSGYHLVRKIKADYFK